MQQIEVHDGEWSPQSISICVIYWKSTFLHANQREVRNLPSYVCLCSYACVDYVKHRLKWRQNVFQKTSQYVILSFRWRKITSRLTLEYVTSRFRGRTTTSLLTYDDITSIHLEKVNTYRCNIYKGWIVLECSFFWQKNQWRRMGKGSSHVRILFSNTIIFLFNTLCTRIINQCVIKIIPLILFHASKSLSLDKWPYHTSTNVVHFLEILHTCTCLQTWPSSFCCTVRMPRW